MKTIEEIEKLAREFIRYNVGPGFYEQEEIEEVGIKCFRKAIELMLTDRWERIAKLEALLEKAEKALVLACVCPRQVGEDCQARSSARKGGEGVGACVCLPETGGRGLPS